MHTHFEMQQVELTKLKSTNRIQTSANAEKFPILQFSKSEKMILDP